MPRMKALTEFPFLALLLSACAGAPPSPNAATAPKIAILCDVLALREAKPTPILDATENRKAGAMLLDELSRQLTKKGYLVVSTTSVGFGVLTSSGVEKISVREESQVSEGNLPYLGSDVTPEMGSAFKSLGGELKKLAHAYAEETPSGIKSQWLPSGDVVAWTDSISSPTVSTNELARLIEKPTDKILILSIRERVPTWAHGMASQMKASFVGLGSLAHPPPQSLAVRDNGFAELYLVEANSGKLVFFAKQALGPNGWNVEGDFKRIAWNFLSKLRKEN